MCVYSCSSSLSLVIVQHLLKDKQVFRSPLVGIYGRFCCLLIVPQDARKAGKVLELVLLSSLELFFLGHCIYSANNTGFTCDGGEGLNSP